MSKTRVNCTILGAGGWGTALACNLANNGKRVLLWARKEAYARELNELRENKRYLPGVILPQNVEITNDLEYALQSQLIVLTIPVKGVRAIARQIAPFIEPDHLIVNAAKGLEVGTMKRMSEILAEELPKTNVMTMSGPNHAEEVSRELPSITVVAGEHAPSLIVQRELMTPSFRVYTNTDLIGVELAGAVKNVIAIAAGISDGLGFGDNTKSAVITRGLAEISRFGVAYGANPMTFFGIAGMGDLIATCTSHHSRNRLAGELIGQKKKLDEIFETGQVVEGIPTTASVVELAKRVSVELPIVLGVNRILAGAEPLIVVEELMERDAKKEIKG
ncbi:MAG: NAD(P)-dependent glycerol-3-phosphate dehydrogenase [Firmicutes bacterium]|nr:NAD(P)-dependent glycerol-3-phosphate dehydrogenase [Bacillota bacterium]